MRATLRFLPLLLLVGVIDLSRATTHFVSPLGDDSDGASWMTAFRTVQKALDSVPDDRGGHRIIIRPGTYMEANLDPAHRGAHEAYNTLEHFDGSLGSGATGYAVIDCSDPDKGLKSVDWWGPFKANPEFSSVGWDRWTLRRIYVTGGDGGLFWDLPPKVEPFSILVEDCVGVGRAFGGGVAHFEARPEEPILFRRCKLWCLDWWGDAAGAYVRAENAAMPATPDVTFEDCILVGPDNAHSRAGNPGFSGYSHVSLRGCQLVSLNFSQPRGTPGSGIIHSTIDGKLLYVDLEDCTLMGYKVFGAGKGEIGYSAKGDVKAYVQYEQEIPAGIHRLGQWPADIFADIALPEPGRPPERLHFQNSSVNDLCESAPVVWKGRLCLLECVRPPTGGEPRDYYIRISDVEGKEELGRCAEGYGLACAIVHNDVFHVFASRFDSKTGTWNDVTRFKSIDLQTWEKKLVLEQEKEHLFNSSVCADGNGFVMAYESDDPTYPAFTIKFARSEDLEHWKKLPDAVFGKDRYAACPCIRYSEGWYYLMYLEHRRPRWFFETYLARSRDLKEWTLSPGNPILSARKDDGINASDPDIAELQGRTFLYYSVGDQRTWTKGKVAMFEGRMGELFARLFGE